MIEAQVLLGAQETFLDCPAQPGRRCQIGQGRFGASIGEVVRDGLRVTQVSARQQPAGKAFSGCMASTDIPGSGSNGIPIVVTLIIKIK